MKLQKTSLISLLTLILLLIILVGHFLPPSGILAIPLVISLMAGLIFFTENSFNIIEKSILSYLYIGLNDVGVKLFAGGIHDREGMGWLHMMLFIGLAPCFVMLLIAIFKDDKASMGSKVFSIIIFVLLIYVHINIFENLGVADR